MSSREDRLREHREDKLREHGLDCCVSSMTMAQWHRKRIARVLFDGIRVELLVQRGKDSLILDAMTHVDRARLAMQIIDSLPMHGKHHVLNAAISLEQYIKQMGGDSR